MWQYHDPQEDDPRYRDLIKAAEQEAEASLGLLAGQMGACHSLWAAQKRILKERHGIDWKTPSELNPNVVFD